MRRRYAFAIAGTAIAAGSLVRRAYRKDLDAARARLAQGSRLLATRSGTMEYAVEGQGAPLFVIHGAGGGFDQGLELGQRAAASGWQVIAPSRFGYLRSDMPPDASPAAQADAFVELLDALGIARLPVMGVSAGAFSAAAFAIRNPERCSALVFLVPAASISDEPSQPIPTAGVRIMDWAIRTDVVIWAAMRLFEGRMIEFMLGTDSALVRAAPQQEQRVRAVLRSVLPTSARARGLLNDALLAGSPPRLDLACIHVPTLVVSAEDDLYGTARSARHIAANVSGARLVMLNKCGHLFVEQDDWLFAEVSGFLRAL